MWTEQLTPTEFSHLQNWDTIHFYSAVIRGHDINKTFNCAWHEDGLKFIVLSDSLLSKRRTQLMFSS